MMACFLCAWPVGKFQWTPCSPLRLLILMFPVSQPTLQHPWTSFCCHPGSNWLQTKVFFELLSPEDHKQTGPSMLDQENHQTYNGLLDGGVQQHTEWQIPQLADLGYRTCISAIVTRFFAKCSLSSQQLRHRLHNDEKCADPMTLSTTATCLSSGIWFAVMNIFIRSS